MFSTFRVVFFPVVSKNTGYYEVDISSPLLLVTTEDDVKMLISEENDDLCPDDNIHFDLCSTFSQESLSAVSERLSRLLVFCLSTSSFLY